MSRFSHEDRKMYPQGQGFRILPSLWGHFIPITWGLTGPHTHTHAHSLATVTVTFRRKSAVLI